MGIFDVSSMFEDDRARENLFNWMCYFSVQDDDKSDKFMPVDNISVEDMDRLTGYA